MTKKNVGSWLKRNKKRIVVVIGATILFVLLPWTIKKCHGATEKINKKQFVEMHWNEMVNEIQFNPKNLRLKNLLEQACTASQKGNEKETQRILLETKKFIEGKQKTIQKISQPTTLLPRKINHSRVKKIWHRRRV